MKSDNKDTNVEQSKQRCDDKNCPIHGSLAYRGRSFVGTVVSDKMHKTAVVEWTRRYYLRKYERYEKRRTKLKVHNSPCINAKEGDIVKIIECRPLSKTKNFVIVENLGKEKGFTEKMEALEESKVRLKEAKPKEEIKTEV